jgi:hypothetical protein
MPNLNDNQKKVVQYVGLHERLKKLSKWAEVSLRDPIKDWLRSEPEMSHEIAGYGRVFLSSPAKKQVVEFDRLRNDLVMAVRGNRISTDDLITLIEQQVLAAAKAQELANLLTSRLNTAASQYIREEDPPVGAPRSLQIGFTPDGKARAQAELRGLAAMERAANTNRNRSGASRPSSGRPGGSSRQRSASR